MEADEALLVEWLHYEEHDRRNDGQISQCAGHVIGESNGRGAAAPCPAPAAHFGQVVPSAIGVPQLGQKATGLFEMNGTLAERPPACNGEGWILGSRVSPPFLPGDGHRLCPTARLPLFFNGGILIGWSENFALVVFVP